MTIHCRLDELMRERGLTARQLSGLTGITEAALSEYRTDKNSRFSRKTLNTLCKALQCTPGDLIVYIPDAVLPAVAEDPSPADPHA